MVFGAFLFRLSHYSQHEASYNVIIMRLARSQRPNPSRLPLHSTRSSVLGPRSRLTLIRLIAFQLIEIYAPKPLASKYSIHLIRKPRTTRKPVWRRQRVRRQIFGPKKTRSAGSGELLFNSVRNLWSHYANAELARFLLKADFEVSTLSSDSRQKETF